MTTAMDCDAHLTIEGFAPGGDGVATVDGRTLFVRGAIVGERVKLRLPNDRSGHGPLQAELVDVLSPSPDRRTPACSNFGACGGCQWLHVAPRLQRETKARAFVRALGALADGIEMQPIAHADQDLGYRGRATLHVSRGRLGFSRRGSHEVIAIQRCSLLDEKLNAAIERLNLATLPRGCTDVALACDEAHVSAAFSLDRLTPDLASRLDTLVRRAGLKGGVALVNGQVVRVFGKPTLSRPAPCSGRIQCLGRPDLFAQAHARANAVLVAQVLEQMGEARGVLELHGGTGNFTLPLAERVARVTSIELCAPALELARQSARQAGLTNVRLIVGNAIPQALALARDVGAQHAAAPTEHFDALLLDPPRAGAEGIARVARAFDVRRVVYVSCNPATLARDAQDLVAAGYRPTFARAFDLFPQTIHLEGVMAFDRA
jgi:23S rRNA (uracil1939-C5)-methyltransferase